MAARAAAKSAVVAIGSWKEGGRERKGEGEGRREIINEECSNYEYMS